MRCKLLVAVGSILVWTTTPGWTQAVWPSKEVRIIVPFAATGGAADLTARLLSEKLKVAWKQSVIVDNIAGAGGSVGTARVAKSTPDGHTLGMTGDAAIVVNVSLYKSLAYDPLKDLTPIMQVGRSPNILVANNDIAPRNFKEFIAWARDHPGKVKFNSAGYGTSQHMGIEQLRKMARIQVVHVPSKDATTLEVIGGHVDASFMNIAVALPLVQGGKLRALAQSGPERSPAAPDIPTVAEQGYPEFNAVAWFGLVAPAGTPQAIVQRIYADTAKALTDPDIRTKLTQRGVQLAESSPEAFANLIRSEIPRIADLLKASGIKLD